MVEENVCQCYGRGKCINLCSGRDNDKFGESTVRETTIGEKTVIHPASSFHIEGSLFFLFSDPYTTYQIWIEGIVDSNRTPGSERILANTDVDQPSAPFLANISCYDTGKIYVEWNR